MKTLTLAGLALACSMLCACSTTGGADVATALKEIASDPRCGHTDRIQGNLGGMGGNNLSIFAERTCPPAAAPPAGGT